MPLCNKGMHSLHAHKLLLFRTSKRPICPRRGMKLIANGHFQITRPIPHGG